MQQFLSVATLGVLGVLAWMFLSGDGAAPQGNPAQQSQVAWNGGGAWNAPAAAPATTPPFSGGGYPAVVGSNAPPSTGTPTFRIASFNIEVFGDDKASNVAVMYTLAEIVRRFEVVAIQEIRTQDDYFLSNFLRVVNATGANYAYVVGPRIGNSVSTEQYAFLFNADRIEVDPSSKYTLGDPENMLHREPLVATFRARGVSPDAAFTFTLVNVHVDPDVVGLEVDALAEAYRAIRRAGNEDDVIMLGDFNADERHLGRLGRIPGVMPLINHVYTNARQDRTLDNILIHMPSTTEYVGRSGVFDLVRELNLSQANAELVSDHFPVWAEFSVYELDQSGRVASRQAALR